MVGRPKAATGPSSPLRLAEEWEGGRRTARIALHGACTAESGNGAGGSGGGAVARALRGAFLPDGYPASVSSDYLSYQLWDSIQGLSSYVRGMLASQAMLAGVGVGRAAATPLAAAFQFFVKDFAGMLGGILFASAQGAGFDCFAKQWRLTADVMNDVGLALELASPLLPGAFLLLACLGSIARAITGVAGGATRMALTQHFAAQRNAADIAAKEGSQETAVALVGMVLGMLFLRLAADLGAAGTWGAFWALTALHVWANVRAMRCLRIASLNQARLALLLHAYLRLGEVLTPEQVAARESLVPPPLQRLLRALRGGGTVTGLHVAVAPRLASLSPALQRQAAAALQQAQQRGSKQRYVAVAAPPRSAWAAGPDAAVLLERQAGAPDMLQGFCAALLLAWGASLQRGAHGAWPPSAAAALADVDAWLAGPAKGSGGSSYSAFVAALRRAGWAVDRLALQAGQARLAWGAELRAE